MAKYNGYTFIPHRKFTEKEKNMTLAQIDRYFGFTLDFELGMFKRADVHGNAQKHPYSHESFYENMKDEDWADIYICEENGKYYVLCSGTIMEIKYNK